MKQYLALLLVAVSLATVGCGRSGVERASIYGKVTIDGQPVESGSIRMISLEPGGGPSVGGLIQNGEYDIAEQKGPTLGKHRVEVQVPYMTGRKVPSPFAMPPSNPHEAADPSGMVDEWVEKAPPKYNTKSTLNLVIKSGRNEFDIAMQSK
jgi:hypothetical protein